jgi:hypothetical protein
MNCSPKAIDKSFFAALFRSVGWHNSLDFVKRLSPHILVLACIALATPFNIVAGVSNRPFINFDQDGQADIAVYRPGEGLWYVQRSSGGYAYFNWGLANDNLVPGYYDSDAITDVATHRKNIAFPETGTWWILNSTDLSFSVTRWASNNLGEFDTPVPADYDGDGRTDLAYYRTTDVVGHPGTFFILHSSNGGTHIVDWGNPSLGDRPVPADYDGDGKADLAIYRNGEWWILQSSNGSLRVERFGIGSDKVIPGDFDGDGKADLAVWRSSEGMWFWLSSLNNSVNYIRFGLADDKPVADDFDGDNQTDVAVFRPTNGTWYILNSQTGTVSYHQFGLAEDIPLQNVFVR